MEKNKGNDKVKGRGMLELLTILFKLLGAFVFIMLICMVLFYALT